MSAAAPVRIRIVVVDDQGVIRAGLRMILDHEADLVVVAEAADGHEAVEAVVRNRPDVVLMDVRMPRLDGLAATRRIRDAAATAGTPAPGVLVLTTFDDDAYVLGAIRAGASGFLLKDAGPDALVSAVRTVHRGEGIVDPAVTLTLLASYREAAALRGPSTAAAAGRERAAVDALSSREREILAGLARGWSNRELAQELFVTETTVKTHVSRLLAKLGLSSRLQAVVLAYESGFVVPGSQISSTRSAMESNT